MCLSVFRMCTQTNTFLSRLDMLEVFLSKFLAIRDLCNPEDGAVKNPALTALFALRDMMTHAAMLSLDNICVVMKYICCTVL